MIKEVNVYLSIVEGIRKGKNLKEIAESLGMTKQALNRYVSTLKRGQYIKKVGYGVWDIDKEYNQTSKQKSVVIGRNSGGGLKENTVRGHGFLFKLQLPLSLDEKTGEKTFRNWDKREKILSELNIKFKPYYVGGVKRGQRLVSQNTKVALTNKSILINFPESYIAETATLAQKDAVAKFLRVVKALEKMLRADFSSFGKYKFRVARQHYALIKNSLARQYLNNEYNSKKLHIYSDRGLWLLIDNSFNLEELETVHKDTAVKDNTKVQNFFNGLDMIEGYTPQFVLECINKLTAGQAESGRQLLAYAEQNREHLALIQEYREESRDSRKLIQELLKQMKGGNN